MGEAEKKEKQQFLQFLGFKIENESYGVPIHFVREIIAAVPVVKIPNSPPSVKGIMNLRGNIVPLIDLRSKFGLECSKENINTTCFIVIELMDRQVGVIVDHVSEVMTFDENQIESSEKLSDLQSTEFIIGLGKIEEKVVILVDLTKIITKNQLAMIDKAS